MAVACLLFSIVSMAVIISLVAVIFFLTSGSQELTMHIKRKLPDTSSWFDKIHTQQQLANQLTASLTLQKYLPEAFEFGQCSVGAQGTWHKPLEVKWTCRRGDGKVITRLALDVPFELWPRGLQADYMRLAPLSRKRIDVMKAKREFESTQS